MSDLNERYADRITGLGFRFPRIMRPAKETDLSRWAVIACDQHTSDPGYWSRVESIVGSAPSTLRIIYPEVYLEEADSASRIASIHRAMTDYIDSGVLAETQAELLYIERTTEKSGLRQGILLAVDLERYDFSPDSTELIRATEGTILERIPPRVRIREGAPLELPHTMILIDDREKGIIEPLAEKKAAAGLVYDAELMLDGGHLAAWNIADPKAIEAVIDGLTRLGSAEYARTQLGIETPFLFAMGDGNHSLATAKTVWETMKRTEIEKHGSWESIAEHPARWALAEIVNLHSPGLRFEPIHRVLFNTDFEAYRAILERLFGAACEPLPEESIRDLLQHSDEGQRSCGIRSGNGWHLVRFPADVPQLPNGLCDAAFAEYRQEHPGSSIDYVHGWEHTKKAAGNPGSIAAFFPVIARERLFPYVANQGPLPRKAFSMGDAEEKRYYMEARRIVADAVSR